MQKKTEPVKTVLTICMGLVVVYLITHARYWLLALLIIGLAGMFSSYLATLIDKGWMKLAFILGLIIPNILLGAIFYFLLFPIALASRIFGKKDPLNLRNRLQSNYVESRKEFSKESFEKYW